MAAPMDKPVDPWSLDSLSTVIGGLIGAIGGGVIGFILGKSGDKERKDEDE